MSPLNKPQLERVNRELLDACAVALERFQELGESEHADVRVQLSHAINRARTEPDRWYLLDIDIKPYEADPFAGFGGEAA